MHDVGDFRRELLAAGDDDTSTEYRTTVFIERVCDILAGAEVVENASARQWQGAGARQRKIGVSGAALHPEDGSVSLILAHVDGAPTAGPPVLSATDVNKCFKMLSGFLEAALAGSLDDKVEKNSPVADLIVELRSRQGTDALIKARLLLVTDSKVSERVRGLSSDTVSGLPCEYHVWDIARLNELAGRGHEPLQINLLQDFGEGVPCLPVNLPQCKYESYLCVVPASLLADLYGRFGARLLEANVRGFLSDRGKVNRGIRATIQSRPEMFFAYNNGLTATATVVEHKIVDGEEVIASISDLQIVNGGQTTASLFWSRKKHKTTLEGVFVQMKLTVIPPEMAHEFDQVVSDISKFANSQNKVSEADLFANHPFHREIEKISRRTGVPAKDGQHQTYWFYERARAQYSNEYAFQTPAQQKSFEKRYPKRQIVTKTDLAKFMNSWEQLPHVVSSGAQKSFKRFADMVTTRWDRNAEQFNEVYFKRAMGIAIIFRALEALVPQQPWYEGHRAAVVPYTIAALNHSLEGEGRKINLLGIWSKQGLLQTVEVAFAGLMERIWLGLSQHPQRKERAAWGNLGEWFKSEPCWDACKNLGLKYPEGAAILLISEDQFNSQDLAGAKAHRVVTAVDAQKEVMKLRNAGYWERLKDWDQEEPVLAPAELEAVCRLLASPQAGIPSEAEGRVLMQAKMRAETNGFLDAKP